jgi:hypothetical protein
MSCLEIQFKVFPAVEVVFVGNSVRDVTAVAAITVLRLPSPDSPVKANVQLLQSERVWLSPLNCMLQISNRRDRPESRTAVTLS